MVIRERNLDGEIVEREATDNAYDDLLMENAKLYTEIMSLELTLSLVTLNALSNCNTRDLLCELGHRLHQADNLQGYCLLHQKEIEYGFRPHCHDIVLRPYLLLSYYLVHEGLCDDWECGDKKALEYLERVKFNDYPKGDSK